MKTQVIPREDIGKPNVERLKRKALKLKAESGKWKVESGKL